MADYRAFSEQAYWLKLPSAVSGKGILPTWETPPGHKHLGRRWNHFNRIVNAGYSGVPVDNEMYCNWCDKKSYISRCRENTS